MNNAVANKNERNMMTKDAAKKKRERNAMNNVVAIKRERNMMDKDLPAKERQTL